MEIQYILSAKIYPGGKFEKEVQVQKEVAIHKTLMPKDVSSGQVTGYVVPRRTMMGSRKDYVGWEFKVPKWVCLENKQGIVFDGLFRSLGGTVRIEKIAVDVVQEELYHQEGGELDATKRQLTVCSNAPSTYLYPPLSTTIGFSFPLQNSIEGHHGNLTYSLESPFLAIRHFIRLLIHMTDTHTPICVGLPIEISQELMSFFPESDGLPTYQSIARDGERLPDYTRIMMDEEEMEEEEEEVVEEEDEEVDVTDRSPPPQQQQEQQEQQEQRQPRRRRKRQDETMVILERTLDDFGLIKS
ncbi:hypothetical protein DFQ28_005302 [Apophysomyces sp. BC1034]|nr:hypothetical protein DFQ28_005302 [Apophysomyces sp. BC1034]